MSIIKFINGKNRGAKALKQGIRYVLNPEKTSPHLVGGRGITVSTVYQDMQTVQRLMGKEEGRSYIHFILSFNEEIYNQQLRQIAEECAAYFTDNQSVWAVHDNTAYRHIHFIVNTVNVRDGKKFSQSKREMLSFRETVNGILERHGITAIGDKPMAEVNYMNDDVFEDYYDEYDEAEYGYGKSSFGMIDPDEREDILQAEKGDKRIQQVIRFYEGQETSLPEGMGIWEAQEIYEAYYASENLED